MSRSLSRFYYGVWLHLRRFLFPFPEEEVVTSPSEYPSHLETLRREAAGLTAMASGTRLALAEKLRQYDELDVRVRQLIHEGCELDARPLLAQMESQEAEIQRLLHQHESQRRTAAAAVAVFREDVSRWRASRDALKDARKMESVASQFDADTAFLAESAPPQPGERKKTSLPSVPGVPSEAIEAARSLVQRGSRGLLEGTKDR